MKTIITLLAFIISVWAFGQTTPDAYYMYIKKADSLYKAKNYKAAAQNYSSAFQSFGWKGFTHDRYNAAKAWAQTNVPDSAFDCLTRIIKKRLFTAYDSLINEKDFQPLHTDKRWQALADRVKWYSEHKVPEAWFIAGTPEYKDKYLIGLEKGAGRDGKTAVTLKVNEEGSRGFGNLMQNCSPDKYIGKRIRMSGYMKSKDVDWASFWLRIDQAGSNTPLAFDNMLDGKEKRPIKGTTDWKKYEIVLDVPEKATNVAFGIMLGVSGQIWVDDVTFEIVDKTVPVTGKEPTGPENLDFEK